VRGCRSSPLSTGAGALPGAPVLRRRRPPSAGSGLLGGEMLVAILKAWALLLGMFMLMIGNGLQGTLLGVRGGVEGFSGTTLGYVMAGYFIGFLGGTRATPWMLRRVG